MKINEGIFTFKFSWLNKQADNIKDRIKATLMVDGDNKNREFIVRKQERLEQLEQELKKGGD